MFEFLLGKPKDNDNLYEFYVDYLQKKSELTELSIEIAANRIADVIAKCGFEIISSGDASEVEYMLNVKPNANQTATDFWKQAVYDMIVRPEGALIVNMAKGLYLCDSWTTDNQVLKERRYSQVSIKVDDDTLNINRTFKAADVVHLRYSNPRLIRLLKQTNKEIDALFGCVTNGYKAKAPKVRVSVPSNVRMMDENGNVVTSNEYAEKIAKKLSENEIKSIVAAQGIEISSIDMKNSLSSSDITTLRDSVFSNTAAAFGIPKNILFGDVINQSNNEFLTYACEPIMSIIDNALCGAWLSKEEYIAGDRIIVNKLCVKHIDVIESANNLDKLYQNGWSHNDILKLLGQPAINEEWADMRRFTKNYAEEGGNEVEE